MRFAARVAIERQPAKSWIDRALAEKNPQAAIEAPRVASFSYPRSDHPHPYAPGVMNAEGRIPVEVVAELERRGHIVERWPDWTPRAGSLCTIVIDREHGTLTGGADPRRLSYAIGW